MRSMNDFDEQPILLSKNEYEHPHSGVFAVTHAPDSMYIWEHHDIAERWYPLWDEDHCAGWLSYHKLTYEVIRRYVDFGILNIGINQIINDARRILGRALTPIRVKAYVGPITNQYRVEVILVQRAYVEKTLSGFNLNQLRETI